MIPYNFKIMRILIGFKRHFWKKEKLHELCYLKPRNKQKEGGKLEEMTMSK